MRILMTFFCNLNYFNEVSTNYKFYIFTLNLEQSLWISCIVIPCLSIALVAAPYDEEIMSKAIGKDWLCSVNWTVSTCTFYHQIHC